MGLNEKRECVIIKHGHETEMAVLGFQMNSQYFLGFRER